MTWYNHFIFKYDFIYFSYRKWDGKTYSSVTFKGRTLTFYGKLIKCFAFILSTVKLSNFIKIFLTIYVSLLLKIVVHAVAS